MLPFDVYPIRVTIEPEFSTKLELVFEDAKPYAAPAFGTFAILGFTFNPVLVAYLFKFIQVLDYISILGIEIPLNLREFLELINLDPLDLVPQIFSYPKESTLNCSQREKKIFINYSCSPFLNLYKYIYIFTLIVIIICIRLVIQRVITKTKKKSLENQEKVKESKIDNDTINQKKTLW